MTAILSRGDKLRWVLAGYFILQQPADFMSAEASETLKIQGPFSASCSE